MPARLLSLLFAVLALLPPATARAATVSASYSSGFVLQSNVNYLSESAGFSHYLVNQTKADQIGDTGCTVGVCGGAYIGYSVGARFGGYANTSLTNSVISAFGGTMRTTIERQGPGPLGVGDTFRVKNGSSIEDGLQLFGKGRLTANVGADVFFGAALVGDACFGGCINDNDGNIIVQAGMGSPQTYNIFGLDTQANTVTFLNQTTTDALPQSYQSPSLPISAQINNFDLSGVGTYGSTFTTQQEIAGVYVDVAQLVASAFGIPPEVLSGSALGFNYVALSAKIGMAIDLVHEVTTNIRQFTTYLFSSPVQVAKDTPSGPEAFSDWTTAVELAEGESMQVRAGFAQTLSILPVASGFGSLDTEIALNAAFKAPIKLMEIKGNGLSLGPAYSDTLIQPLANLATVTDTAPLITNTSVGNAITLSFSTTEPPPGISPGFVFVETVPDPTGSASLGYFAKVSNFGDTGCNEVLQLSCLFDSSFEGLLTQRRTSVDTDGNRVFTFASDFMLPDRLAGLPRGAAGSQSDMNLLQRRLETLPLADYTLPIVRAPAVPEPQTWALLLIGFGLIGGVARRQARLLPAG